MRIAPTPRPPSVGARTETNNVHGTDGRDDVAVDRRTALPDPDRAARRGRGDHDRTRGDLLDRRLQCVPVRHLPHVWSLRARSLSVTQRPCDWPHEWPSAEHPMPQRTLTAASAPSCDNSACDDGNASAAATFVCLILFGLWIAGFLHL